MNSSGTSSQSLSVLIPTLNGGNTFRQLLTSLTEQETQPTEIIVADSGSTDETLAICQQFGVRVLPVLRREFDHGGTRTMLAGQAKGEILVFFTQDAVPVGNQALSRLVAPLAEQDIGCSYGRQVPAADATLFARHLRLFNYPQKSDVRRHEDRKRLGFRTVFVSNSFSAYKKTVLASVGYFKNGLIFGEDTCTVGKILKSGQSIAYCAEAQVVHSHNYTVAEEFMRSYDIGVLHSSESWLLDEYGQAEGIGTKYVGSLLGCIWRERKLGLLLDFCLRIGGKVLGYKIGRYYMQQPKWFRVCCSMNSSWWQKELN